jgi:hypothetical protein
VAEKSRTPRPPRPVQAPKRRDTQSARGGGTRISWFPRWPWLAGIAGVAVVVGVVIALSSGGTKKATSSTANVKAVMLAAGCTYRDVKPFPPHDKVNYHADVPTLTTSMKGLWSTFPPSGGGHYPLWAIWGFYTSPVNPRQVVHNEEHGAVGMWWGPKVSAATVNELHAFYDEKVSGGAGDGMFGTPLTSIAGKSLGDKIALTSWTGNPDDYYRLTKVKEPNGKTKTVGYYGIGHIAICPSFNEKAFTTFRDAFRGKGPEGIPLSDDEPGMGPETAP